MGDTTEVTNVQAWIVIGLLVGITGILWFGFAMLTTPVDPIPTECLRYM